MKQPDFLTWSMRAATSGFGAFFCTCQFRRSGFKTRGIAESLMDQVMHHGQKNTRKKGQDCPAQHADLAR